MRRAEIVIVGGGLAGLAAASALVGRGLRVTLFESRPRLGGLQREPRLFVNHRGAGLTRACGTGACAVAAVAAQYDGPSTYRIDVPGGTLTATVDERSRVHLKGPAVLVAEGSWLA